MSASPHHVDHVETDVLIIGGGVAGCLAAVEAVDAGAEVVIADKAKLLERAGSVGGGVDQYLSMLNSGPEWDTPEFLVLHVPTLTDGLIDMEVAEQVIHEIPRAQRRMEDMGISFRDRDGEFLRTRAFGLPGEYYLNFEGNRFKHRLGKAVRRTRSQFLARTMMTDLLVDDETGEAYGAVGFNVRTGQIHVVRARSVIIATGEVNRISRNSSGIPFDSWHYPYNTGDGHAMAFRVGAELTNMEFVEATLTPRGFSTQGTNSYAGLGAHFINRHGERFMFRYDELGEKSRRTILIEGIIQEILAGNDPIYIDLRHLPEDVLDTVEITLQVDRHTLPAFFRQRGIDIRTQPIEISISELSIRKGGTLFRGSGLVVAPDGRTSVPNLYAAGDCSIISAGIAAAAGLGAIAGRAAARNAAGGAPVRPVDAEAVERVCDRVTAPLLREDGLGWRPFEDEIRSIVTDHLGFHRDEVGMKRALDGLLTLGRREPELAAENWHALMRTHESTNIRLCAELLARAAIERRESRSGAAHRRVDFPDTDEAWRRLLVLQRDGEGGTSIRHRSPDDRTPVSV